MINSQMGTVKLTKPRYELCGLLNCTKEEVDISVRAVLYGDLSVILHGLIEHQGLEQALEMWTDVAYEVIKEREGDKWTMS